MADESYKLCRAAESAVVASKMSIPSNDPSGGSIRAGISRSAGLFGFWLVLRGIEASGMLIGLATASAATWTSLRLMPPEPGRVRFFSLGLLGLRFLWNSLIAGVDVAKRAFDPRLPLRLGFVTYTCRLDPSPARSVFCAMTSLMPGSVPTGSDEQGRLVMHCLDTSQPLLDHMAQDEASLIRGLGNKDGYV